MNLRNRTLALILAAGLAGTSAFAVAATSAPLTPVDQVETASTERLLDEARLTMKDAVAAAEKAHGGKALRATLRDSRQYGLVWDVRLEKGDKNTRVRTLIDAKTGKVLATDVNEISRPWSRGEGRHCDEGGRYGANGYNGHRGEHHCR